MAECKYWWCLALTIVAFIVAVIAMATPYWVDGGDFRYGMWQYCYGSGVHNCVGWDAVGSLSTWFRFVQAFQVIGSVLLLGCLISVSIHTRLTPSEQITNMFYFSTMATITATVTTASLTIFTWKIKSDYAFAYYLAVIVCPLAGFIAGLAKVEERSMIKRQEALTRLAVSQCEFGHPVFVNQTAKPVTDGYFSQVVFDPLPSKPGIDEISPMGVKSSMPY